MPEYLGSEIAIALQKRLRARQPEISRSPDLANGGRVLHFLDPEQTGWTGVRALAEEDNFAGFPAVRYETAVREIETHLGRQWKTPRWRVLSGREDQTLSACEKVVAATAPPDDWRLSAHDRPDEAVIAEVQSLNASTGVSPYPAYYMRSEAIPALTVCVRDPGGALVATASVVDRYHPKSRLAGQVFAGKVSIAESQRGKGLGKFANAVALIESHRRFGWKVATEQAAADNPASLAMIEACGLTDADGLCSVIAINSDESFTR